MLSLVADSNVLFTYFWERSALHIALEHGAKISTSEFFFAELSNHARELQEKAGISNKRFAQHREELVSKIAVFQKEKYAAELKTVKDGIRNFPSQEQQELLDDADFLALAIQRKCPLWSQDRLLKKQKLVPVLDTREIIELLG